MVNNKEKIQILLSMIDNNQEVFKFLPENIKNNLPVDKVDLNSLDDDIFEQVYQEVLDMSKIIIEEQMQNEPLDNEEQMLESSQENEVEENTEKDNKNFVKKDFSEIADLIFHEKPQIAGFLLSKMDEDTKSQILQYLPHDFIDKVNSVKIEQVPLSEKVFETLLGNVFN